MIVNSLTKHRPGLVWIILSGVGAAAGAWLAVKLYPSAGFAQNPTGQFAWILVYFALIVGLLFGVGQSLALLLLRGFLIRDSARLNLATVLWIPATAAGIFAMIFPLWWVDAEVLLLLPTFTLVYMAPGIALLSGLQWAVMRTMAPAKKWFVRTAVGGLIGALVGLHVAGFASMVIPLPGEALWAGAIGLIIGTAQSRSIQGLRLEQGEVVSAKVPVSPSCQRPVS